MKISEFDYHLPEELIAQSAPAQRDSSRLMVINRADRSVQHRQFSDIVDYFEPGDCLVINQSKVIPARFYTQRHTGGHVEGLFLNLDDTGRWQVLLKHGRRLKPSEELICLDPHTMAEHPNHWRLQVVERIGQGNWLLAPTPHASHLDILEQIGITPLPPYIHRQAGTNDGYDQQRYQTVYAAEPGSAAAPTAGLHFSQELIHAIQQKGIRLARVTLHVGQDTFKPVTVEDLEDHQIHSEFCQMTSDNAALVNQTIAQGHRVVAVGTTSVRTLESAAKDGHAHPFADATRLFITPGYQFQLVNRLITNFHLPRTTLLALVAAFADKDLILDAYRQAVHQRYRFFSYGDAMIIL